MVSNEKLSTIKFYAFVFMCNNRIFPNNLLNILLNIRKFGYLSTNISRLLEFTYFAFPLPPKTVDTIIMSPMRTSFSIKLVLFSLFSEVTLCQFLHCVGSHADDHDSGVGWKPVSREGRPIHEIYACLSQNQLLATSESAVVILWKSMPAQIQYVWVVPFSSV